MRINNNLMAMNTHRQLGLGNAMAAKSMEKLSSGFRINRAGDDAAGLAISEKMRGQIRGLNQASRNSQDAISLIQTAEGALNETHAILQRMRELAVQASTDTNTETDRGEIQKEINQLTSEINRIGNTTEFNTMNLLDGSKSSAVATGETRITATAGTYSVSYAPKATWGAGDYQFEITSDGSTAGVDFTGTDNASGLDWSILDNAQANTLTITKDETNGTFTIDGDFTDTAGAGLAIDSEQMVLNGDNYVYNNHGITFEIAKSEFDAAADGDTVTVDLVAGEAAAFNATAANIEVKNDWTQNDADATKAASLANFEITTSNQKPEGLAQVHIITAGDMSAATGTITVELQDADGTNIISETLTGTWQGQTINYDNNGVKFDLTIGAAQTNEVSEVTIELDTSSEALTEDKSLSFQVGANESQAMALDISDMRSAALGISATSAGTGFTAAKAVTDGTDNTVAEYALNVTSSTDAASAITTIQSAIDSVSAQRSKLGAVQNRLEHTIKNLDTSAENLQASESRIRDVDMAKEMMEFTKNNILQQAAQAMLAQANQAPQGVLQLLR